jgi:hypothetical protein
MRTGILTMNSPTSRKSPMAYNQQTHGGGRQVAAHVPKARDVLIEFLTDVKKRKT